MKHLRTLFLLAVCMVSLQVLSDDAVEINGIYYNLVPKAKQAEVTSNPNKYTGKVVIPASVIYEGVVYNVTSIGHQAFYNCYDLTSVTIPNSVTTINSWVFSDDSRLTSVTIGDSVTYIGDFAFNGCRGLTSVNIPNSVTTIASSAFEGCSSLISVNIADIAAWCNIIFSNRESNPLFYAPHLYINGEEIKNLVIPNNVTTINHYAFVECSDLISVNIPNSVIGIGRYAFYNCRNLTSVTIPNSVTSIGTSAFRECSSLISVTIGNGIKYVYDNAFGDCSQLTDVYCSAESVPGTSSDAFKGSYIEYATLHVPNVSLQAYKDTEPWSQFGTIKALDGDTPETPKCATPIISFGGKKLTFDCETEGVEYVTEIKDADIGMFYDEKITLSATYEISVYATKAGYNNSDKATATLVWANATFTDTTPSTDINNAPEIPTMPILIQSNDGTLTIQGADDGTQVSIYNTAGQMTGSAVSNNGRAIVSTNMETGTIVIVKIGNRAIKVAIK